MSTIDLESGEPESESTASARRRARREAASSSSGGSSGSSSSGSKGSSDRENASLVGRLDTAFSKIADQVAVRGDEDGLAEALREERHAMSQGLVSLTSSLTILRVPLIIALSLIEPFLAFRRVGVILFGRFLRWREQRIFARQQAQEEWEQSQAAGMPPVVDGTVVG